MRHRFMTSTFRIVSFVIVSISIAGSADAQTVTLESLETATLDDHPQLGRRRAEIRAAATRVDAVRAEMRPSLYLDVGVNGSPGGQSIEIAGPDVTGDGVGDNVYVGGTRAFDQPNALQPFFRYSAGLRFDGPLYDFGRTAARVDAVEADVAAQTAEIDVASQDLVRATRAAYVRWLATYQRRVIVEASLRIAETRVANTEEAVRAGARPGSDRDVAGYEFTRLRLQLARARADEDDQRAAVEVAARVEIPDDAIPDPTWLEAASPDAPLPPPAAIAALELRRAAIGASLRAYRRRYNPVLGVSFRLGAAAQRVVDFGGNDTLAFFPAYSVQVGLSMPLWDARLGPHLRREAEAREAAIAEAEAEVRVLAESERGRARLAFDRANEQVLLATEAVRLAETIATNAEERYRAVGGSIETVVMARQRELSAQADLLESEVALATSRLRLRPIR